MQVLCLPACRLLFGCVSVFSWLVFGLYLGVVVNVHVLHFRRHLQSILEMDVMRLTWMSTEGNCRHEPGLVLDLNRSIYCSLGMSSMKCVSFCLPFLILVTVNITQLLYKMSILHQTNPQCRFKMWPMHDLTERWASQTQGFSLPSSLGPELSRFWGNRTTVSHHQPPLPSSQTITFSLPVLSLYCLVSAVTGCLAAVDAGNHGSFCPLASVDVSVHDTLGWNPSEGNSLRFPFFLV